MPYQDAQILRAGGQKLSFCTLGQRIAESLEIRDSTVWSRTKLKRLYPFFAEKA
jgi:hypothetical protein